jgi:hypothetical protein
MGDKLVVGPFNRGFRNDRTAFVIDNDNFPTLINAYQWRGRVKRKRGTSKLNRIQRYFDSTIISYNSGPTTIILDGLGNGNILTGFSLQSNGNIVPGSVVITDTMTAIVYTDPAMDGTLSPSGTINYATGDITIASAAGNPISVIFLYYPDLPVMGLETFDSPISQFPFTIAFDTTYSYNIQTAEPYGIYDVSFYKNPPASADLPGYIPKTDLTPTSWNGQDYQQFWTVNYQGAMWTTNGMNVPFVTTNIGMQYIGPPDLVSATWISPTEMDFTTTGNNLVVGDFVYVNEFTSTPPADALTLNFQTGYVTVAGNTFRVKFPFANITNNVYTPGIVQYLTNRSDSTKDGIRWYDGDPTNGSSTAPILTGDFGWVNFAPPLSQDIFSIADLPPRQYYLVGAKMIVPFKDRLLFIGPVVQTSTPNSQVYLQDTVIYSQNGTPYYTCSFDGSLAIPTFHSILLPINQTATQSAYWEDQTGFGGFISAGISQPINTASANEDALILGFSYLQTRFVYTGNDIVPFNFFLINSELGSSSTFSAINLDRGVLTRGNRGFVTTSQTETARFDLEIPDQIFQNQLTSNGTERVTAQRDFINEWIYFTYPKNNPPSTDNPDFEYKFPNQTMFYNYRDQSWGLFNEAFTHYGQFQRRTGYIWATIGDVYPTWEQWNDPWDSGTSTLLQPEVIAGNQQGFVVFRADGTGETESLYVQSFSVNTVVSPDHSLDEGDYITFSGCLGTIGAQVNGKIFSVSIKTVDSFILDPPIVAGTYFGGGEITRMYLPYIQSKQFPTYWNTARKTRIGVQQYLLTRTPKSQIQLLIFLSQNATFAYNEGPIIPSQFPVNSSLIYSTVLYTCPESTNLGLTPANSNLNTPTADSQAQIWHRINTSLIGDTVQVGFTMSDAQMRDEDFTNQFEEIEIHGFTLDVTPSQILV